MVLSVGRDSVQDSVLLIARNGNYMVVCTNSVPVVKMLDAIQYVRYYVHMEMYMYTINATTFRKDLFNLIDKTIKFNEVLIISTKEGNAILLSEEEYNGLLATAEILSNRELYTKIREGLDEDLEACVAENEVTW
ncbi:Antitoxin component YafN of the YafNO toxin-antitoxin module, PHD/YefM family [Sphaerochaeta associata]|uniref:Antitoxin n=1 Tax=Sphaerochaeta associata TaxID=1129264 RepID=A0ABY4DAH8_9SPIR|nr:type II toxin-antitoxin system Phd/YefM family antitoxin [Sphaerochaeta associata]UOM51289.1 type II toxin-antitoxin system Phd/YefM family antitoxin [Sphaerochaeta associata]SMP51102.1 Antitoxin component YafN of the YafNO toxin-antitoxin module, PHD/YefM family [Sphaerochaeta associata]